MMLHLLVPMIVPIATWWVLREERRILAEGAALTEAQLCDARRVGITDAAKVRVLLVKSIPWPLHAVWYGIVKRLRLFPAETIGLTLGHGIYICTGSGYESSRDLLVHELAHVAQYERLGGVRAFLREYLTECLTGRGYPFGHLEQEAQAVAREVCRAN